MFSASLVLMMVLTAAVAAGYYTSMLRPTSRSSCMSYSTSSGSDMCWGWCMYHVTEMLRVFYLSRGCIVRVPG